jgi:hypothetical protein
MYNFQIAPKICKYDVVYCDLYTITYLSFFLTLMQMAGPTAQMGETRNACKIG